MNLDRGWNLSDTELLRTRLLEYFVDFDRTALIPSIPDWAGPNGSTEYRRALQIVRGFGEQGLAQVDEDYDQNATVQPLDGAARLVEDVRARRVDKTTRNREVLDALLHWLYEEMLDGRTNPLVSSFTATPFGRYYGTPFTQPEVARGTDRLKEDGYVRGSGTWGHGIIRPSITAKGQRLVESGRSVHDETAPRGGDTYHLNQSGDHLIAQVNSPGASIEILRITEDHRHQALQLASTVEQAHAALGVRSVDDAGLLRAAVAVDQDDPSVVRSALERLKETLIGGGTDLLGRAILGSAAGLFAHYGVPT